MNENKNIRILFATPNKLEIKATKIWLKEGFFLLMKNFSLWLNFIFFAFFNLVLSLNISASFSFFKLQYFWAALLNSLIMLCGYRLAYALTFKEDFKFKDFLKTYEFIKNQSFVSAVLVFFALELIFDFLTTLNFPEIKAWFSGSERDLKSLSESIGTEEFRAYFLNYLLFYLSFKLLVYFSLWAVLPLIVFSKQSKFPLIIKNNFLGLKNNFFALLLLLVELIFLFLGLEVISVIILAKISLGFLSAFIAALLISFFLFYLCCIFCAAKSIFME